MDLTVTAGAYGSYRVRAADGTELFTITPSTIKDQQAVMITSQLPGQQRVTTFDADREGWTKYTPAFLQAAAERCCTKLAAWAHSTLDVHLEVRLTTPWQG